MNKYKWLFKGIISIFVGAFITIANCSSVEAKLHLTQEEKEYIEKNKVIKASSIYGIAPLQYADKNGEVKGISKRVLEKISDMTGLKFEYKLYNSVEEAIKGNNDIIFGIPENYAPKSMVLSKSFLKSETILYTNSSLKNSENLEGKIYAALRGSELPQGIKEENAIYFNTREESLNAVESGQADYGYGNAYSVAFYILQNNYKNIVMIPKGKESREYCIGFIKNNKELQSIINKAIDSIDEREMQTIILYETSQIDRKITPLMVIEDYGKELTFITLIIIGVLIFSFISKIHINEKLKIQNRRYEILAQISNEYVYEYYVKSDYLELSKKCIELFGVEDNFEQVKSILKDNLLSKDLGNSALTLYLPIINGEIGVFKTINLSIRDSNNKLESIIGKLIDISEEAEEKKKLITKSTIDGLTGLYNATTAKELIAESIKNKYRHKTDALILMDCDNFKNINDTYGHFVGDQVLEHVGKSLKHTFRETDIIGRIGGDEFCVYVKDIESVDFLKEKCNELSDLVKKALDDIDITVSIGAVLINIEDDYEELFKKADTALYQVKRNGKAHIFIYNGEEVDL